MKFDNMVEKKNYMQYKLDDFLQQNNPTGHLNSLARNPDIGRSWKMELANKDRNWKEIKNNQDVIALINRFENEVNAVKKIPFGQGSPRDDYNMAIAEYRAIQGLRKLAKEMSNLSKTYLTDSTDFTKLTDTEVDELFTRMEAIIKTMDDLNTRRMFQD